MVHRPGSARGQQLHDVPGQEAALEAIGQALELVQQGIGDFEGDHAEDLGAGDGRRR
jgi:hypothetical protein